MLNNDCVLMNSTWSIENEPYTFHCSKLANSNVATSTVKECSGLPISPPQEHSLVAACDYVSSRMQYGRLIDPIRYLDSAAMTEMGMMRAMSGFHTLDCVF